jgi:hypothetical protein
MLRKHIATMVKMNRYPLLKELIREYFGLPAQVALTPALYQRGLGQADLVLCLLRTDHFMAREFVAMLIGHPIIIGPPCLLHYRTNGGRPTVCHPRSLLDRRIIFVAPANPRQPCTEAHLRWSDFKAGRTPRQVMTRGSTKRDVRRALRMGWIRLEEVSHAG